MWSDPVPLLCGQVKADRHSKKLTVLQHASRNVNEMAANVVASTRTGQENLEEKGECRSVRACTRSEEHLFSNVCNNLQTPWTFLGCLSSS